MLIVTNKRIDFILYFIILQAVISAADPITIIAFGAF